MERCLARELALEFHVMYVAKENSPTTFSKGLFVASGRIVKQTLGAFESCSLQHSAAISGNKRPWCEGDQREPDSARMLIYVGTQALELLPTPTRGRVGGSGERAVPSPLTPSSVTPRPFGNPMQPREQGTKHVELRPPLTLAQAHSHSRSLDARARQTLNEEGGGIGRRVHSVRTVRTAAVVSPSWRCRPRT